MTTVILYKINRTKCYQMAEQGTGYSIKPWGRNTAEYEGEDDGGKHYELPEGFEIAESVTGEWLFYDRDGGACGLIVHNSGLPQVVSLHHGMPVLRLAE